MKKPIILLDCDGVLADFTDLALQIIEEETGKKFYPIDIPRWDVFESLGFPEIWEAFEKRVSQVGLCKGIKPYPQSLGAVKKLVEKYEVLIVTAPVDALPWMYERAHWIEDHFQISKKKVIFAHAKQFVRGDVLVDDKPDNIIEWATANPNGLAVLWEHSYNRDAVIPGNAIRVSDWTKLLDILKERFDED